MPTLNCFSSKFGNRKVTKSVTLVALLYLPGVFAEHHSTVYSSTGETKSPLSSLSCGKGKRKATEFNPTQHQHVIFRIARKGRAENVSISSPLVAEEGSRR